ncbi:MAG: hypothetical protein KDD45_03850, partial [Bdellovibrionales bacterium]|nr:hypothetical protein [Bdellovibrionales bacterium]
MDLFDMNVNTWFEFHARRPIRYILWLFLALNIAFLVYTYVIGSENQYKSFKNNTISPLLISLQNNDRVLMEYSLEYSIENLGAKEIYLCQDNIVIASPSRDIYSCSDIKTNNFFEELTTFSLPSFQGYKVYIVSSIWPFEVNDLWFLPLSLIIFFLVSWVVNNLQKRIAIDILGSVEKIFEGNEKIDIDEFEIFRQKFISSQEKSNNHKKTK